MIIDKKIREQLKEEFLKLENKNEKDITKEDTESIKKFAIQKCEDNPEIRRYFKDFKLPSAPPYDNLYDMLMDEFQIF